MFEVLPFERITPIKIKPLKVVFEGISEEPITVVIEGEKKEVDANE